MPMRAMQLDSRAAQFNTVNGSVDVLNNVTFMPPSMSGNYSQIFSKLQVRHPLYILT